MKVQIPNKGTNRLKWAQTITRAVNKNRPRAGYGLVQVQTDDGTVLGLKRKIPGLRWTGVAYVAGRPFRDTDMASAEISGSDGIISDNSTDGAKTWIKIDVSPAAESVSYEDAPSFVDGRYPPHLEYYERAKTAGDIHVTRFG